LWKWVFGLFLSSLLPCLDHRSIQLLGWRFTHSNRSPLPLCRSLSPSAIFLSLPNRRSPPLSPLQQPTNCHRVPLLIHMGPIVSLSKPTVGSTAAQSSSLETKFPREGIRGRRDEHGAWTSKKKRSTVTLWESFYNSKCEIGFWGQLKRRAVSTNTF